MREPKYPDSSDNADASFDDGASTVVRKSFFPKYGSAQVQMFMVALIGLLGPGMFNALNGLGGAGLVDPEPANNANVALYSTFSVAGFLAGAATNKLGVRITLSVGGLGYGIYTSSLLCYKHTQNAGFLLFAGLQLGLAAGLFWSAQGLVTISYPTAGSKGKSISWFWVILQSGSVIGSLIALVQNLNSESNEAGDATFYAIIALSLVGMVLALLLKEAKHIVRSDGSRVILPSSPTWKSEIKALIDAIHNDYYILLFFPMFAASNVFYPYQFNTFNLAHFTIRTRSLNNVLYWTAEILGACGMGYALDIPFIRRSVRAKLATFILLMMTCGVWAGGYVWQEQHKVLLEGTAKTDWADTGYLPSMFLYMAYGFLASAYQTCLYWFLGALTDDSQKIANLAGFYKGIQSAGQAVSFRVNTLGISPMNELFMNWGVIAGAVVVAAPVVVKNIKDK
ncbi:major facilitator superfamily domain-containing protein [Halenospora varia]|nr:major facilitator superfamily domain-containing protein [Halenospora varia]